MPTDVNSSRTSVLDITADLANGRTSSRELIETALARIADPAGEGARSFVKVYGDSARAAADAQDRLRKAGYVASPLSGMTAVEYIQLRAARVDLIARVSARMAGFDALLMPTVAITAPPIAAFEREEDYRRLNAL